MTIKVNQVTSSDVKSGIFSSIFNYMEKFLPAEFEFHISAKPQPHMDIYHYHRPNLERCLPNNSVVTVHHDLQDSDPWLDFSNFSNRYMEASSIICLNSTQEKFLKNKGILNTTVIPHGYNHEIFTGDNRKKTFSSTRKLNIGFISKRYGRKVKGEAYLYELLKLIPRDRFKFTFVGEGRSQDAIFVRNLGFETKVYERLPYRVFGSLYDSIDFLLICSLFEGGPANVPEAIRSSTPILSTNVGMISDFLEDKKNGIILSGNPEQDADILIAISENRENLASILFENAHSSNNSAPSWNKVVGEISNLYLRTYRKTNNESCYV